MGQNFLIDEDIAFNIVDLAQINNYDLIIEVGPGRGALTKYLAQSHKSIIAVELDKRLAEHMLLNFKSHPNIKIINDDILKIDWIKLIGGYKKILLISNLPYSISTPMLLKYLKQNKITSFVCMLQRELVHRLIAKPNTKEYGSISVLVQYYTTVKKILDVPNNAFIPAPKIDSNVVSINKINKHSFDERWAKFIHLCFSHKRKTLVNNLKSSFAIPKIHEIFHLFNIDLNIRAEQLSVDMFYKLYKGLNK